MVTVTDRHERFLILILILLVFLVYITGLFPEGIVDSAKYAAIAREIFENGDPVHLKIHGQPYMHKPPLLFWLGALSFKIFGVSIVAFKIPNLIISLWGVFVVFLLGKLAYGKAIGLVAAGIYAVSEAMFLFLLDVHTDLLLTTFVLTGVWLITLYLKNKNILLFITGFISIGLAMISKGALGLAIPAFVLGAYLLIQKDFKAILSVKWLFAIPIIAVIIYPFLKGVYDAFGLEGIKFYFWSNNIDRIRGDYSQGRHDYLFSVHTLLYLFLPWSFYTFMSFIRDFVNWKKAAFRITYKMDGLFYSGIFILALIVSVSSQQAPHYLLPVIPFISIITARFIVGISTSERQVDYKYYRIMIIVRNMIIATLCFASIAVVFYFLPVRDPFILICSGVITISLIYTLLIVRSRLDRALIPLMFSIILSAFVSNAVYMPATMKHHGYIQASYLFNRIAADDARLYTFDYYEFETYFYPKNVSELLIHDNLEEVLRKGNCWVITPESGYKKISGSGSAEIKEKYTIPHVRLTHFSFKFLNPSTRDKMLSNVYLIRI